MTTVQATATVHALLLQHSCRGLGGHARDLDSPSTGHGMALDS